MKPQHIDDDYTPDNVSGVKGDGSGTVIAAILTIIALIVYGVLWARAKDDHIVIDRETVSIIERPPIKRYTRTMLNYFYPGDTMSSAENGALILWDSTTSRDLIVGFVTDSGTFEVYSE